MSDKLTASPVRHGSGHCAELEGSRKFHVLPIYRYSVTEVDPRASAQSIADTLTQAIADHDAAVNAELIAQRDRLAEACRAAHVFFEGYSFTARAGELDNLGLVEAYDRADKATRDALADMENLDATEPV